MVYIKYLDKFIIKGKCLLLLKALYRLSWLSLLWYSDFITTLKKKDLKPIVEKPCLYYNN